MGHKLVITGRPLLFRSRLRYPANVADADALGDGAEMRLCERSSMAAIGWVAESLGGPRACVLLTLSRKCGSATMIVAWHLVLTINRRCRKTDF